MNTTPTNGRRKDVSALIERLEAVRARMDIAEAIDISPALKFALAAGLPPRMAYTVTDTALYTGFDVQSLRNEMRGGRLHGVRPFGQKRGYRIPVTEVDRWLKEEF